MLFLTTQFFIFFVSILVVHSILPGRYRWLILLISSYIFYGFIDISFPFYLAILTLISYFFGYLQIRSKINQKTIFILSIIIPVSALFYFKYMDFFSKIVSGIPGVGASEKNFGIILPVGISFYIFKIISYHIDLQQKRIEFENHLGYFSLYLSFFPQLLAGPIERAKVFLPELKKKSIFDEGLFYSGIRMFIRGAIKKAVIADRLAIFVNEVFSSPDSYSGVTPLIASVFYSFQIYCDFSGYSDIAIGLGRILGYRTQANFSYPYFSRTISEFWSNWHISLSSWLRDYIFLPLSFSLFRRTDQLSIREKPKENIVYPVAAITTMFIAGLWHGAAWTFIVWGSILGLYMVVSRVTAKTRKTLIKRLRIKKILPVYNSFRIIFTFFLVSFAWIFFRADSIGNALNIIKNFSFGFNGRGSGYIKISILIIAVFVLMEYISSKNITFRFPERLKPVILIFIYVVLICILIVLGVDGKNEFLYFNF